MQRSALTLILLLGLAACQRGNAAAPVRSRAGEGESCATTGDCEPSLACVELVCRTTVSVPMGDYHWAAGNVARDRGDPEAAEASYRQALSAFEAKRAVPPELLCDYGGAIRVKKNDRASLERSARLLHGCFTSALPGSTLRHRAARELAELAPLGLDPAVLARDAAAGGYMTGTPAADAPAAAPALSASAVDVDITPSDELRGKQPQAAVSLVSAPAVRESMAPCLVEYAQLAKKDQFQVAISLVFRARYDDFDEEYTGGRLEVEAPPDLTGPEALAGQCIARALGTPAAAFGERPRGPSFKGTLLVKLRPKK